jgi:hypothetical protein
MAAQPPSRQKVSAPVTKRSPHTLQRYTGTVVSKKMSADFIELEVKFLTIENLSAESGVRLGGLFTVPLVAQSAIVFVSTKTKVEVGDSFTASNSPQRDGAPPPSHLTYFEVTHSAPGVK